MDPQCLHARRPSGRTPPTSNFCTFRSLANLSFFPRPVVTIPDPVMSLLRTSARLAALALTILMLSGNPADAGICPAVGANTDCGVVITITDAGNYSFSNNQGPYDQIEDTLIGIVNHSSKPITSLKLSASSSTLQVFAFDGDGICGTSPQTNLPYVPGPIGCPFGPTGYEGPGVSFNPDPDLMTGTINFSPPIAAQNGTAYFSLEQPITSANDVCASIVNGAVKHQLWSSGGGTNNVISATFIPNFGYTLADAASLCGFDAFNWQQTITQFPLPSGLFSNDQPGIPLSAPKAFNDPLPSGYTYCDLICAVGIPTYLNIFTSGTPYSLDTYSKNHTSPIVGDVCGSAGAASGSCLRFYDNPYNICFPNPGTNQPSPGFIAYVQLNQAPPCLGSNPQENSYFDSFTGKTYFFAPTGSQMAFTTHLVGIKGINGPLSGVSIKDLGVGFSWTSNYNGTAGGGRIVSVTTPAVGPNGILIPDPNSGTGGITITNVSNTTSYQYPPALAITAINGVAVTLPTTVSTLLSSTQLSYYASGFAYSRVSKTFNGTITITNISSSEIVGPFQIVLDSLTAGVTLVNATSMFGGWPFITVQSAGSLAPGQSATVNVQFSDPSNASITFTPLIYTGSFN